LEEQQIAVLAHQQDESVVINLQKVDRPGEDMRTAGHCVTTWPIPISDLQPLLKKEVLLRGEGGLRDLAVHVGLLLIPLQPSTMVRRHKVWDNHGFPVHTAFEDQYLKWEVDKSHQHKVDANVIQWEDFILARRKKAVKLQELLKARGGGTEDGLEAGVEVEGAGEAPYELIRQGVPDHLRGQAWQSISGAQRIKAQKGTDYYTELVHRAYLEGSEWSGDIAQDIPRTFPDHSLLCSDRGRDILNRVLLAYSLHNPQIGYCQSMNFICAFLLLHMEALVPHLNPHPHQNPKSNLILQLDP